MNSPLRQKLKIICSTILISVAVLGIGGIACGQEAAPGAPAGSSGGTGGTGGSSGSGSPLNTQGLTSFPLEYLKLQPSTTTGNPNSAGIVGTQNQAYLKSDNPLVSFILQIINFIALSIASLSFLAMVVAGFMILVSTGNATTIQSGISVMINAAIGLAISLSAYYIVAFVQSILFETVAK